MFVYHVYMIMYISLHDHLECMHKYTCIHVNWMLLPARKFGMRSESSAADSLAIFQSEVINHLCNWLCIYVQVNIYTCILNYKCMQDIYVYMHDSDVYMNT